MRDEKKGWTEGPWLNVQSGGQKHRGHHHASLDLCVPLKCFIIIEGFICLSIFSNMAHKQLYDPQAGPSARLNMDFSPRMCVMPGRVTNTLGENMAGAPNWTHM